MMYCLTNVLFWCYLWMWICLNVCLQMVKQGHAYFWVCLHDACVDFLREHMLILMWIFVQYVCISVFFFATKQAQEQCLSWCNRHLIHPIWKCLTAIQMACRWLRKLWFWQEWCHTKNNVWGDNLLSVSGGLMVHFVANKQFSSG